MDKKYIPTRGQIISIITFLPKRGRLALIDHRLNEQLGNVHVER